LAVLGGCGGEPFALLPVTGKITYDDGSLIPGDRILVSFVPVERRARGKDVFSGSQGELDVKTGQIVGVTTHKYGDGTMAGRCKVTVAAIKNGPNGSQVFTAAVPERYQQPQTTPLECEVARGRPVVLTLPKPR
jgi:hypothetical protein